LADVPLFRLAVSPNKIFDYMAAGLPILTNVPGVVGDCVATAGAGHVVAPGHLAAGLRRLADATDATLEQLGSNGRAWLTANQSRGMMRERLLACLDLDAPASAPPARWGATVPATLVDGEGGEPDRGVDTRPSAER
jgi:hypothetical protein